MSARLKALGISNRDMMAAKQYERLFTNLGWSRNQIDQALVYGSQLRGSPQDMADQFEHFAKAKLGMSSQEAATAVDVSLGLIDLANESGGIEGLPALPERTFTTADQRRLDEIRQLRRDDFQKYENDKQMQLDELDLLEAKGGPAPSHKSEVASTPQPAIKGDRILQIREMRRNNDPAYAANAAALEREELSLLEGKSAPGLDPSLEWRDDPDIWSDLNRMQAIREIRRNDPDAYARNEAQYEREELSLIQASLPSTPSEASTPAPAPAAATE